MAYASKRLEMYFQLCSMLFNTFQQSCKNAYVFGLLVCTSSVHAVTVNIVQMSLNLYMLFMFDIERIVLKMVSIKLRVRLQR